MRRSVRLVTVLAAMGLVAATVSPSASGRDRTARPMMRGGARLVVHGRVPEGSRLRPTSLDVLSSGGSAPAPTASIPAGGPRVPQSVLAFDALSDPISFPADPTGALGDDYFVTAVNTQVAVWDLTGTQVVAPIQLDQLHSATRGRFAFDPKVVYDAFDDTFVLVYLAQEDPGFSRIVSVAIPNATATDVSTWCAFSFPGDAVPGAPKLWADYPGLGFDARRVTIATNEFTFPTARARFTGSQILSIPKRTLYDCGGDPPAADAFVGTATRDPNGRLAFTIQPAQTVDRPAPSQLMASAVVRGKGSYLVVWRIRVTAKGPRLSSGIVKVGKAFAPPFGTQAGGGVDQAGLWWDAGDKRLTSAFYDAETNRLYAAHTVAVDLEPDTVSGDFRESAVRWYEVRPVSKLQHSALLRKGTVGKPETSAGWPALATDATGNLFITYSRASAVTNEFLSAWVAEIPPGSTAATSTLLAAGLATYNTIPGPERWGDFNAINRDPTTPTRVAVVNQYAVGADTWQQVVHVVQHA